jgi:hypothetical protein
MGQADFNFGLSAINCRPSTPSSPLILTLAVSIKIAPTKLKLKAPTKSQFISPTMISIGRQFGDVCRGQILPFHFGRTSPDTGLADFSCLLSHFAQSRVGRELSDWL